MSATISVAAGDALWLVKLVLAAASKDDMTPVLCAAQFTIEGTLLRATSTDRYRVHTAVVDAVVGEDESLPPEGGGLLHRDQLVWLSKNANAYSRNKYGSPLVRFTFPDANSTDPAATISVIEHDGESARSLSNTEPTVQGNFPPVLRLLDAALEGEPAAEFGVDPRWLADTATLQRDRYEALRFHTMRRTEGSKQQPFLIESQDGRAWALIQPNLLLS